MTAVFELRSMHMTEAEYDCERAKLSELYGESDAQLKAKRDQAFAAFFHRTGWTQEQLAKKEGKSQFWVMTRLRFGRFLSFKSTDLNHETLPANLTERRFRSYWERTSGGNERQRFTAVMKLMAEEIQLVAPIKESIWRDIVDEFGDGKWHPAAEIADKLKTSTTHVMNSLCPMEAKTNAPPYDGARCERKQKGTEHQFRIYRGGTKGAALERMISSEELAEKLGPILKALNIEADKKVAGLIAPVIIRTIANDLQKCLTEWTK
jgi:hypothetical protein